MNLCTDCFPEGEMHEVLTVFSHNPCVMCGRTNGSYSSNSGPQVLVFRSDPRNKASSRDDPTWQKDSPKTS